MNIFRHSSPGKLAGRLALALLAATVAATVLLAPASPAAAQVTFLPDLRVTYVSKAQQGLDTVYTFKIANIGIDDAYQVGVTDSSEQAPFSGDQVVSRTSGHRSIAKIASGQTVTHTVRCTPQSFWPAWQCTGAFVKAQISNDLDPSNNSASST